ncbi:inorganic pyrophosphatase [Candidatus Bathyarchaeota archaeon]|nr:inorganic pyrophosphatase [Candidatus Bathyarchaeota archaeon]
MNDDMIYWKHIVPGPDPPSLLYAFIECPKGTHKKYELSKSTNLLIMDRVLHSSVVYPQDYGFIPGTYALDGDPLDVLVISNTPTQPMTLARVKPIGVLVMQDEKGRDEKILSVPRDCPFFGEMDDLDDLPRHYIDEIREFFNTYKNLEEPAYAKVKKWHGHDDAIRIISNCISRFKEEFGNIAITKP